MPRLETARRPKSNPGHAPGREPQTTLSSSVALEGVGVHSSKPARIVLHPAEAGAGIAFLRSDLAAEPVAPALWSRVVSTELCTSLGLGGRDTVATVEHAMAALAGLGVDNALIEVDGPEVPVLDGSSAPFVAAIDEAGVATLTAERRCIEILRTVRVERGGAFAELGPGGDGGLTLDVEISFDHAAIGRQRKALRLDPATFRREIARARTFGFIGDIERLWRAGFALGASLENSIAISADGVLNPEGLRFRDEFVRHKMLDAVGDLALAGAPIRGAFRSRCGGHALNHAALQALFADSSAWRFSPAAAAQRGEMRADIAARTAFGVRPALAPDRS
ncbi:MAG: UDP-3-O-acyl-N-acetylglucosamine deacetylase [Rhodoblastus sp.]|nr:UDP-3-O-acyl-N-acetylglucosamine deacetylase [Rhodoblastus sp.]